MFTSPAQTIATGVCSNALTIETRDAQNQRAPVQSFTAVSFSASGTGGFGISFFGDPQCLTAPNPVVTIPAGQATATIYIRASQAGLPLITASGGSLTAATQQQNIVNPPNQLAFLTGAPTPPILAGQCFFASVESRFNNVVSAVTSDSTISLQATPTDSLRFFSNAACTTSITSVVLPRGQSSASFYVKAISGGVDEALAVASFDTAQLLFNVQSVVRKGTCSMSSLQTSVMCPITPQQQSLAKTMLVYQGVSTSDVSGGNSIRCRLATVDAIACERPDAQGTATIQWQTAELPTGLDVQRSFSPVCLPSVTLPTPVNPSSSFVLSAFSGVGTNYDGDDMSAARLVNDGGVVSIDNLDPMSCTGFEFQVVELSGITTLRGNTPGMTFGQRVVNVGSLPAASPNSVVFNQSLLGSTIPMTTPLCPLLVRSEIDSPTSLAFTRGADSLSTSCSSAPVTALTWERVDFGARGQVQKVVVDLQTNSQDVMISQVDPTRTLVFAGGQGVGGQASGETSYSNTNSGAVGVATARFDLNTPNNVRVTRGRSTADGIITMYVLELEP